MDCKSTLSRDILQIESKNDNKKSTPKFGHGGELTESQVEMTLWMVE